MFVLDHINLIFFLSTIFFFITHLFLNCVCRLNLLLRYHMHWLWLFLLPRPYTHTRLIQTLPFHSVYAFILYPFAPLRIISHTIFFLDSFCLFLIICVYSHKSSLLQTQSSYYQLQHIRRNVMCWKLYNNEG